MNIKTGLLTILSVLFSATHLFAQHKDEKQLLEYERMLNQRADKILKVLEMTDSAKYGKVHSTVVMQYKQLNLADQEIAQARKAGHSEKVRAGEQMLQKLHKKYIDSLSVQLDSQQVEKVKDGMTYSVLPVTYKAYQDMIPSLKPDEKEQILTWLTEARELAMDQGSSDKKHQVFGKYKGRINNYLSARGYDLQKERSAWAERSKLKDK
jgi:hypothetical protein